MHKFQPLSTSISPAFSLLFSRKQLAWFWEAVSCLQKKKERFPQSGHSLDTVFCLCTITGTQGAAQRASALQIFCRCRYTNRHKLNWKSREWPLCPNPKRWHIIHKASMLVCDLPYLCVQKSRELLQAHTRIQMSVFCIILSPFLIYCSKEIMSIPAALFLPVFNFGCRNISL